MPTATRSFTADYGGELVTVAVGELVTPGHELLRRYPENFSPDPSLAVKGGRGGRRVTHSSRGSSLPHMRHVARHDVKLSSWAYSSVDSADGFDGLETGGGLYGARTLEGIRIADASGPGQDAERHPYRLQVDWDYIERVKDARTRNGERVVGHWHTHIDEAGRPTPSEADLRTWSDALDREDTDVFVGAIVVEGQPYARWYAWTISDDDGERVCEPANLILE
jgi:proteasome lid subunit RPN8/RPN11